MCRNSIERGIRMDILEEIRLATVSFSPRDVERLVNIALAEKIPADIILTDALLKGLAQVGELYRENAESIPEILSATRCVTVGLGILQPHLRKDTMWGKNKVVIGTVEGDLHDVGKNLVSIILTCSGFQVIDLGVDVSAREFLRALREQEDVKILCLSCLLSTCMDKMAETVSAVRRVYPKQRLRIMVGGASVSSEFAREIGADCYTADAEQAAEAARMLVGQRDRRGGAV